MIGHDVFFLLFNVFSTILLGIILNLVSNLKCNDSEYMVIEKLREIDYKPLILYPYFTELSNTHLSLQQIHHIFHVHLGNLRRCPAR